MLSLSVAVVIIIKNLRPSSSGQLESVDIFVNIRVGDLLCELGDLLGNIFLDLANKGQLERFNRLFLESGLFGLTEACYKLTLLLLL